ncbi:hypothetical protein GCM10010967_20780 [Dyadobacter beijingensis]|uniref:Outer membrane protein beta-barrel domain-containing protein n=1 Tax=Dyadobacter beijingensis TaxID=365489 RepID=A0ABQ2HRL6_9BACT|nr:hypothetical protein [Dyadobacter beijingensis]GGM88015.1 hypothetical protein GCM10010967_20780 [Dyadobacter beijingensis]
MKQLAIILLVCTHAAFAQEHQYAAPSKYLSLSVGPSKHGTGDMRGIMQRVTYTQYFKKRLFWYASVGADLHDGEYQVIVTQPSGEVTDHSFRYTAGAMQLTGGAGFSALRSKNTELGVRLAAVLRYQSSSLYDYLNIIYDPKEIGPYPAMFIANVNPQRTFAAGICPELFFNQRIFKSFTAGISGGFQLDTNGDVLTSFALSVGKYLR